jgi:general secretion pathway protein G
MVLRTTRAAVRTGFTLMEMLVVVAIIVVLAGIGGYYLLPRVDESKEKAARAQLKGTLTTAVETYKLNNGDYPPNLEALTQQQPNGGKPILEPDALRDPWGQAYGYDPAGPHNGGMRADIWCNRPNGQIGNWSQQR